MVNKLLTVAAALMFLLAAVGYGHVGPLQLVPLGLAFLALGLTV